MPIDLSEVISSKLPKLMDIEVPPKIFVDMDGEYTEYLAERSLTTRFPVKERYQNPLKAMQGGMIVAAMDNTFGPLSYMVGPPSVTAHINATYIRPVTKDDLCIYVKADVVEMTRNMLHMRAEVKNMAHELVAIGQLINYFVKTA